MMEVASGVTRVTGEGKIEEVVIWVQTAPEQQGMCVLDAFELECY